jgi:hypothetical protein
VADDSAEWAYDAVSGVFEARIPWGLLGVTDPSSRQVLFETATAPQGHRTTAGLHVAVATFEVASGDAIVAAEGRALETLPRSAADGRIPSSPLFQWPTWEAPTFLQVEKASLAVLRDALPRIPDRPAEIDLP